MSDPIEFLDADFQAADAALGTLAPADQAAAERRMRRDGAFRADVEAWQARLAPLALQIVPQEPPAGLWRAIEAGLPRVAPARGPAARPASREGFVPAFWRWLALGSGILTAASFAALAALVVLPATRGEAPGGPLAGIQLAAAIESEEGLPLFAVVLDPQGASATLVPLRLELAAGQVPELWLVREDGAPESLGIFDADEPLRLRLSPGAIAGDLSGGALAISLEPEGGSPTGQPTGPVVGTGALSAI